jgi:hypothetical protein
MGSALPCPAGRSGPRSRRTGAPERPRPDGTRRRCRAAFAACQRCGSHQGRLALRPRWEPTAPRCARVVLTGRAISDILISQSMAWEDETTTSEGPWRPLSAREAPGGVAAYDALHPGVPEWLRPSLWEWIKYEVTVYERHSGPGASGGFRALDRSRLRALERAIRIDVGWDGDNWVYGLKYLKEYLFNRPEKMLDAADYFVSQTSVPNSSRRSRLDILNDLLLEAGSAYRVLVSNPPMLVHRVEAALEKAADRLIHQGDPPGELLANGWQATYGIHPNPSHGYRQAVRAVEAAAIPVIIPNDADATLGRVIGAIRGQPHLWQLSFTHRAEPQRPLDVLIAMLALLWEGQYDRHVSEGVPLQVSQEEAETALPLAVTLVQWFTSDRVSRRP